MSAEPARATLIDGKAFSVDLVDRVAAAAARLEASQGVKPGLAVVIVAWTMFTDDVSASRRVVQVNYHSDYTK